MTLQRVESSLSIRRQPFFYLTASLLTGILIDILAAPPRSLFWVILTFGIVLSVISIFFKENRAVTTFLLAGVFASGALLSHHERTGADASRLKILFEHGQINAEDPVDLIGRLTLAPEPAPEVVYLDLDAESLRERGKVINVSGVVRLLVPIRDNQSKFDFEQLSLDYGSRIRVLVRLERARAFANPGSPDFNQFLEQKGYDLKGSIKSPLLIENIGPKQANFILSALYKLRLRCLNAIDTQFHTHVAGTLKAMLMGNRYYLDENVEERLLESATFHILSISGMHVAIIAWALLGRWSPSRRRRTARVIASLLALWAYTVMVGLSPPVTRATLMITVGIIGPLLFRPSISINTVALAAFVMLAMKPALIADPGFQLSFVAVAAIVAIAVPIISKLRQIGDWRPGPATPHPPDCWRVTRFISEILFWNERGFNREMMKSPYRYRPDKSSIARLLNRVYIQPAIRGIVTLIITSAAIQLATLPLSGFYFNRVAPVGILLNVAAGLLTGVLMFCGIAAILIGAVSNSIAAYITLIADVAHHLLVNQVAPFLSIPGATFRVAHYEGQCAIIYAIFYIPVALLVILIDRWQPVERKMKGKERRTERGRMGEWESKEKDELCFNAPSRARARSPIFPFLSSHSFLKVVCAIGLVVATFAAVRPVSNAQNGRLMIYFLDVGQGDAALIVFPHGATMLVDGGGQPDYRDSSSPKDLNEDVETGKDSAFSIGEMVVSRFLWAMRLSRVDYLLVTHAHVDHIQGLSDVVRNFDVRQAIIARAPTDNIEFDRFMASLTERRVPVGLVRANESFEVEGVRVEILWPPEGVDSEHTSGNDDSIVLRLVYGSTSIMMTGDIEQMAESAIVKSGINLRANVLKTPHHGSRTSSSEIFLDAVQPRFAVISVAERNRFGHPHKEVVERYIQRGIKLFETRRDGMITVETDGVSVDVSTYRTVASGQ
jgi:competence protein ComEC